jgi:hypothetical protein
MIVSNGGVSPIRLSYGLASVLLAGIRTLAGAHPKGMRYGVVFAVVACAVAAGCASGRLPSTQPSRSSTPAASAAPKTQLVDAALAFDPARGAVLAFGGTLTHGGGSTPSAATWQWNGARWQAVAVGVPPPGRTRALFAFDPSQQGLVLMDGQSETQSPPTCAPPTAAGQAGCTGAVSPVRFLTDGWLLSPTGWHPIDVTGGPGVGWTAVGDPARRALVVVGSTQPPPQGHDGTWQHSDAGWALLSSTTPDYGASIGADPISGRLIAYLGQQPYTPPAGYLAPAESGYTHTWELAASGWQLLPPATVPSLAGGVLTPSPDGSQLLLVNTRGETWAWTGVTWSRYRTDNAPKLADAQTVAAATDTAHHLVVLVASNNTTGDTTWTLSGHHWTRHSSTP